MMDMENTPLNNDCEENSPVNVVPRLTMMTSPSTLEAARRPLSLDEEPSEETNGESSLNEEQISEVDEAELNPTDEAELNPMDEEEVSSVAEDEPSEVDEEEPSEVDEEEPSEVDEEELSPVDEEEEEESIDFDDPLCEQALREVNEEDRGEELSQTDEDASEDARPAAHSCSTPPNSRRPKAPRAPRARQQWELYSFRGKDGKRWTLQRRVPREREDIPPNTPLKDTSESEEGSPPAKTRRAHPPRTLFFESSDDEDNPTGVGSVASDFASSSRQ